MKRQSSLEQKESVINETIFSYATPEEQHGAVLKFITSIELLTTEDYRTAYASNAKKRLQDQKTRSSMMIRDAIACFDYCLSDEIRTYFGELPSFTDSAAVYFRSDAYKQVFPEIVKRGIAKRIGYEPDQIIIGTPDHVFSYTLSGNKGMLTPDFAYFVNLEGKPLEKPEPPCGVARQELYRSLLQCGINPLAEILSRPRDRKKTNKGSESYYQKKYRRKSGKAFHATSERFELWERKTAEHWKRVLGEHNGRVILFSSGTASNEAVMRSLARETDGVVFIHPYWYYENMPTAQSVFKRQTTETKKAQIMLINLEPTNYFRLDGMEEHPNSSIREFIESAVSDQKQKYYLVLDSTVNPLLLPKSFASGSLPDNLEIIKTVSVTKHQDGGRNYFFGVVCAKDDALLKRIEQMKPELGGVLLESHIIQFPRPTPQWLKQKGEIVSRLNHEIETKSVGDDHWRIKPYTYHSFIFPPGDLLQTIVEVGGLTTKDEFENRLQRVNDFLFESLKNVTEAINYGDVEMGDSFGLPQTRLSVQGGFNTLNGVTFRLKLPRICPGYDTQIETLERLTSALLNKLNSCTEQLQTMLKHE